MVSGHELMNRIRDNDTIIPKILDLKLGKTNLVDKKYMNIFIRCYLEQESYPGPIRRDYICQHLNRKSVH